MIDQTACQTREKELVFVYNARSDLFSKAADFVHKIISPNTYSCSLCSLTHGHLGMHREWAEFIQSLPYEVRFIYKDQVENSPEEDLPHVWLQEAPAKKLLIDAKELNAIPSLQSLMDLISQRMMEQGQEG